MSRNESRPIKFESAGNPYATGAVIASFGNTRVLITASVEENVPGWMKGKGTGWVTAEYSMLPASTHTRSRRERNKISGRTQEIQRLIGRALRSVVDMEKLGERMITVDCDVLVADGGTRTTSVSGGFVALALAVKKLMAEGLLKENPIKESLAAISVGISSEGEVIADLNYEEDSSCNTDMNIVMTESGRFVEIQGTAEGEPFSRDELNQILDSADIALKGVFAKQVEAIESL